MCQAIRGVDGQVRYRAGRHKPILTLKEFTARNLCPLVLRELSSNIRFLDLGTKEKKVMRGLVIARLPIIIMTSPK